MKQIFKTVIVILALTSTLFAATVHLANGKELSGDITLQDNQFAVNGIVIPDHQINYIENNGKDYDIDYLRLQIMEQRARNTTDATNRPNNTSSTPLAQQTNNTPVTTGSSKKVIIRGFHQPNSELSFDVDGKEDVYISGIGTLPWEEKERGQYDIDGGLGFGVEVILNSTASTEWLAGVNMSTREISKIDSKENVTLGGVTVADNEEYKYEIDDGELEILSLYVKPRCLFNTPTADNIVGFIGGKLSYNSMSADADDAEIETENCFGYGISIGAIIYDTMDFEISFDKLSGKLEKDDYLEGTYDLSSLSFSLGVRL